MGWALPHPRSEEEVTLHTYLSSIPVPSPDMGTDSFSWTVEACSTCPTAPSVLRMLVMQTLLYTVWQQRNNMFFNQTLSPPLVAFKDINMQVVNSITALRTRKNFRALMQL
ncbi:hypothetical protein HID58_072959, partial [Brassica napus]